MEQFPLPQGEGWGEGEDAAIYEPDKKQDTGYPMPRLPGCWMQDIN